jgi:hypothetical protein
LQPQLSPATQAALQSPAHVFSLTQTPLEHRSYIYYQQTASRIATGEDHNEGGKARGG